MVSIITGALTGAAYGALVGAIKYTALWKRILKSNRKITQATLYQHMGISYAINVATLLLVFLLRNTFPWDITVVIVSTAIMLSLVGKLAPMSEIVSHVEEPVS